MKPIRFTRTSQREVNRAINWYERQQEGLGKEFAVEVRRTLDRILDNSLAGERFRRTDARFLIVNRFPYVVYYVEEVDCFWVAAIAHGSRRPGYWLRRKPPK